MSVEGAVEHLQQLGLSGYEAKAYVALVVAGQPLNGYEVAKRSGVPRSTVYETLGKLVARGAAYEVRGQDDSLAYLSLPPQSLLDRMRRDFDQTVDVLDTLLPTLAAPPEVHLIHNVTGRDPMLTRAADVLVSARHELFVSSWPEEFDELRPLVGAASDRGIDVTVMSFADAGEPHHRIGHTYLHELSPPDVALENLGCRLLVVVADRRQALMGGFLNGDAWGVYTENPAVVMVAVEYIRHDIAMQLMFEHIGREKVQAFWDSDPDILRLRGDRGTAAAALRGDGGRSRASRSRTRPQRAGANEVRGRR